MKKFLPWIIVLVIALLGIGGLFLFQKMALTNPFNGTYSFDYPVLATGDAEGNHYVIDTSRRRVSKILTTGLVNYQLNGGSRDDDRFFYANQIAVSGGGYLFLLDETRDEKGFYVLRERILLYSPTGSLLGVLYQKNYPEGHHDPTLVQRNRIFGLEATSDSAIRFFIMEEDQILPIQIDFTIESGELLQTETNASEAFPYPDALLYVADIAMSQRGPVVVLRDGTIRLLSGNNREEDLLLFSGQASPENPDRVVPWDIAVDSRDNMFFVDLEQRAIKDIQGNVILNRDIIAFDEGIEDFYEYDYYRVTTSAGDRVYTTNDEGIVIHESSGDISFISSAKFSSRQILPSFFWWLSILLLLAALILFLWLVYVRIFQRKLPQVVMQAMAVVALVTVVGTLSTFLLISNFNSRYTDVILQRISQMIQILPLVIDGDAFEQINSQADFANESYMSLRNSLNDAFNQNRDAWNRGYYFAIYRILDERLYGFMYMSGEIGMYHPFDWLEGEEEPGIYDLANLGEISTEMIRDISGEWIYGVGPIYNSSGEVVGLFETGTDLYTLTIENRRLITDLVWELVTVWIVLMLLLVEITVLTSLLRERTYSHIPLSANDKSFSDGNLARPLVFLYFTAVSFSLAFLPLLSKDLYQPLGNMSDDIAIALPLSLEMVFFGIATIFTGFLTARHGWKSIFAASFLLTGTGLIFSATSQSFYFFLVARALTGLGSGMGYIALRSFINLEGRAELRNKAYSNFYSGMIGGVNVGLVLGASLTALLGYRNVFWIGFMLLGITAVLFATLYRDTRYFWPRESSSELGHGKALLALAKTPRLWMYFVFLLLPTYAAASYVGFYFPLFAEAELGLDAPQIGRFMIMNGLFIVYLGPSLSRFIERKVGTYWGSIVGSIFWGITLILAGLTGNIIATAIILALMGLTEGFAVSNQNGLYFSEKVINLVGQDRATGYFELFGKVGDTIGPILFAAVLLLGAQNGLIILGIIIALMTIPYMLFVRNKNSN